MKYLKCYESYTLNPLLIKLYNKIVEIMKDIDSTYKFKLIEENAKDFATIEFSKKTHDYNKITLFVDTNDDILIHNEYIANNELIDDLANYIKEIIKTKSKFAGFSFPYEIVDELIEKLDNFELWRNAIKYNL